MRLINQTKNIVIAQEVLIANTPIKRIKGLLGRKFLSVGQALILDPCNSVHTFFMLFSIDLIFVDKDNKVIKIMQNLNPNRITGIYWDSRRVIELPSGSIKINDIQLADHLQLLD